MARLVSISSKFLGRLQLLRRARKESWPEASDYDFEAIPDVANHLCARCAAIDFE